MTLMSNGTEFTEYEWKQTFQLAAYVSKSWPVVEREDLQAELSLWLVKNMRHLERWRTEGRHGENKLRVAMVRRAREYARAQHVKHIQPSDSTYREEEVEAALEIILTHDDWSTVFQSGDDIVLAVLADVSGVYYSMNSNDRDILAMRYREGLTFIEIGIVLDCTKHAARQRSDRAVERLRERVSGGGANWDRHTHLPYRPAKAVSPIDIEGIADDERTEE